MCLRQERFSGGEETPLVHGRQHEAQTYEGEQREQGVAQDNQAL